MAKPFDVNPMTKLWITINGKPWDPNPIRVLRAVYMNWKSYNKIKAQNKVMEAPWNKSLWLQQHHYEKTFRFGNYVLWFPMEPNEKVGKFGRHYHVH
jgi:hypothetical protein